MRRVGRIGRGLLAGLAIVGACSRAPEAPAAAPAAAMPKDAQHAGITTPHGDHTPRHGGLVLMNGELHYEVVIDPGGRHQVWFSDAVRAELPASVGSNVRLIVRRKGDIPEPVALKIDDAGESWLGQGRPIEGEVMVMVTYDVRGAPHEVEIPFAGKPTR
jgi:hypothetical protein